MSTCPFCAEEINADASQCPSCGMELPGPSPANVGDAPPVQSSKSNAKTWIILGGVGCGFCLLVLACLAVFLLPMVNRVKQAAERQAVARNEQFPDSDEHLDELAISSRGGDAEKTSDARAPDGAAKENEAVASVSDPDNPQNVLVEQSIRRELKKPTGELTNADLEKVQELRLTNTGLTDTGLKEVAKLRQLSALYLRGTLITDAGLREVARLTQLKELGMGNTQITDAGLKQVIQLQQIWFLGLSGTKVTDAGLKSLSNCKKLRVLKAFRNEITDAGLKEVARIEQLSWLGLGATH